VKGIMNSKGAVDLIKKMKFDKKAKHLDKLKEI